MAPTNRPKASIPTFDQLMVPTVQALRDLGGSAHVTELGVKLLDALKLPADVVAYRREGAGRIEVLYRAAWARTYLKKLGFLELVSRGVWALTARGLSATDTEIVANTSKVKKPISAEQIEIFEADIEREVVAEESWRDKLIGVLKELSPAAFERLGQRILRESGFTKVEVTGRAGDGGIDGVGVLRVQLISFQVLFQCKRYKDTVSAGAIRDFRGAMVGRTDKGLFITTGRFTSDAQLEATRDGAPPIELIDGDALCDLLKTLQIGVITKMVEQVTVEPDAFKLL